MAETRVINLEVRDNANDVQKQFENLRQQIAKTTQEVDELTQSFGENSQEVTEAKQRLDSLTKSYSDLNRTATDTNATFAEVYGELQPLTTRMGEAEDRLYELALAGKTNTQEYKDLLLAVSNYRKAQIQTDMVVDAAATTMSTKVMNAVNGVASAYSVAEGAAALMGVESEKLQETMVKLQAAMAISQGLAGLNEARNSFVALGSAALDSLKTIKIGILSTGIGALVLAVGLLIANFDKLKSSFNSGLNSAQRFADSTERQAVLARQAVENFDEYERTLKRLGYTEDQIVKKRDKAYEKAIKQSKLQYDAQVALLKESEKSLESAKKFDKFGLNFTGRLLYGDEEDVKANREKAIQIKKDLEKIKNDKFEFDAEQKAKRKQLAEEEEQERKDRLQKIRDKTKEELALLRQYYFDARELLKDDFTRTIDEINRRYDEQIKLAKKYKKDTALLEQARQDEIAKATHENDAKNIATLKTIELQKIQIKRESNLQLQGVLNEEVEAERRAAEQKQLILEAQATRARKLEEQSQSFRVQMVQQGLQTISSITELFGKKSEKAAKRAFQINKAAQIASATIDTYKSATSAYASQFVPIPDPSSPIRGAIAAGVAVAAGLANIAKIASQKFEGGGSTGGGGGVSAGGGGGGAAMAAPNFSVIGSSGVNQLAQLQQQPTRAYVVSGEVTSQQALDRNRVQNATL